MVRASIQFTWPSFQQDRQVIRCKSAMANENPNSTLQQMLGSMFVGTAISFM